MFRFYDTIVSVFMEDCGSSLDHLYIIYEHYLRDVLNPLINVLILMNNGF